MKWTILLACLALLMACGETSGGTDRGGMGGSGGMVAAGGSGGTAGTGGSVEPPPPPQDVDQTCRDWCANDAQGASCHQGPFDSVQPCYEGCLSTYQQEVDRQCEDQWIAIKDCQLDLDCADLFGDCDSNQNAHSECATAAFNREYCESNCPNLDLNGCDRQTCDAHNYCQSDCPTMDETECREQYINQRQCDHEDAIVQCGNYCTQQDLSQCVDQWLSTGRCEFDSGSAACAAVCSSGGPTCGRYWDKYEACPSSSTGACAAICTGDCSIDGVDPAQGFDQCVSSCQQEQPNEDRCENEALAVYDCLQADGCGASETTCGGAVAALSDCLAGMCGVLCVGQCVLDVPSPTGGDPLTIDPGQGFEACLSSCLQQFPDQNDGISAAEDLNSCLQTNGCDALTTTCSAPADTVNLLLTVPFD